MAQVSRATVIAIAAACVAVVTSLIAVIVVVRRPEPEPPKPEIKRSAKKESIKKRKVDADKVGKMYGAAKVTRDGVEIGGSVGEAIGLERGDVVTSLGGRPIAKEIDVLEAVTGLRMMNATSVYVELQRDGEPVVERWDLDGSLRPSYDSVGSRNPFDDPPPPPPVPYPPPASDDPEIEAIKAAIHKIDDTSYEVSKAALDKLFANPMAVAKGARVVPAMKDGKPQGFKLYAIRPSSVFAAVGLTNGDTIVSINGFDLTTADKALELYTRLKDATAWDIDLIRRGRPMTIHIKFI